MVTVLLELCLVEEVEDHEDEDLLHLVFKEIFVQMETKHSLSTMVFVLTVLLLKLLTKEQQLLLQVQQHLQQQQLLLQEQLVVM